MNWGAWLTGVRMARLPIVLRVVRAGGPAGVAATAGERTVWSQCGGPFDEVSGLLDVLEGAELLENRDDRLRLTSEGRHVATQDHQQNGRLLATALIRAGYFAKQIRLLLEKAQPDEETGELICPRRDALRMAPQLVALLRRWEDVTLAGSLRIPEFIATDLLAFWAIPADEDGLGSSTKAIGGRGELYSYMYEREQSPDPSQILWVAQEDETLGYDLTDTGNKPRRLIEVKASTGESLRFYMSANEMKVAKENRTAYEIQFWGGIDLERAEDEEYKELVATGYPKLIDDVIGALEEGSLEAVPASFLVTESATDVE